MSFLKPSIPELDGLPPEDRARLIREALRITPAGLAWIAGVVIVDGSIAYAGTFISLKLPPITPRWKNILALETAIGTSMFIVTVLGRHMLTWYTRYAIRRIRKSGG